MSENSNDSTLRDTSLGTFRDKLYIRDKCPQIYNDKG